MTKLSVNVNKIATLRNTRHNEVPNLERLARIALEAGAAGITIHPRPDRRHIRPDDVPRLARVVAEFPDAEFNIEGNPFGAEYIQHLVNVRPTQATFVPDSDDQFTSDHGFDLSDPQVRQRLEPKIAEAKRLGCRVSLFLDPRPDLVPHAARLGADRVELYTAPYAEAFPTPQLNGVLEQYAQTAKAAVEQGLGVNAGHDLSLDNLARFLSSVPKVLEVSIGHALIAEALEFGLAETVGRYRAITG